MDVVLNTKKVDLIISPNNTTISKIAGTKIDSKKLMNTIVKCGFKMDVTKNGIEFHGLVDFDEKTMIKINSDGTCTLPHSINNKYSFIMNSKK
jgi:hypothetical protein